MTDIELPLFHKLKLALQARTDLPDDRHETALRLFNGYLEGWPDLVVELYADTLVLLNHASRPEALTPAPPEIAAWYRDQLPWLRCALVKSRHASDESARRGMLLFGDSPARKICEHGIWYALELTLHQDTSFYLDTRRLRAWAIQHLRGQRVLNTFAYTGSLGVAALGGAAAQVVQLDRNRQFLNLAKQSYTLNGFPIQGGDFRAVDFFVGISALKSSGDLFDCVFLDPPFFSVTAKGRVDLVSESARLINKIRPLVADGGWLVAINNALFVSGAEYLRTLEALCTDGYLQIETIIPAPDDCVGYTKTRGLPADPAPFNHATKIAVLKARRKATGRHVL